MVKDATPLELDEKSKKFFVEILSNCRTVMNSYDDSTLAEPWLSHYRKIKNDYDSALKDLGPSDQAMASLDAHRHLTSLYSLLAGANAMCSMLGSHMADMKKNSVNALNSAVDSAIAERVTKGDLVAKADLDGRIKTGVDTEISNRTKAGDLVTKEQHSQLCSAAKDMGIQEGRTAAETAIKAEREQLEILGKRKTSLATNGFPLPGNDTLLAGTDAEFETRQTTANARLESLKGKGVVLNSAHDFWKNIWLPEPEYKTFEGLVDGMAKTEPFAGGSKSSGAGKTPTGPMLV